VLAGAKLAIKTILLIFSFPMTNHYLEELLDLVEVFPEVDSRIGSAVRKARSVKFLSTIYSSDSEEDLLNNQSEVFQESEIADSVILPVESSRVHSDFGTNQIKRRGRPKKSDIPEKLTRRGRPPKL
jgi:hypothetical protein